MKAYLVLENGQIFEGERIGAQVSTVGELVFNTGMVGYIETLTDQRYSGQMVMQTFPMIGNYGMISEDAAEACAPKAYIVRELCDTPSNFRCDGLLGDYLVKNGVPGICGVDTRALTRILRDNGTMNAALVSSPDEISAGEIAAYRVVRPAPEAKAPEVLTAENERARVALIDYGAKMNIAADLLDRGVSVTVYSADVTADEILSGGYAGAVLASGAGDPADYAAEAEEVKKLLSKLPIFGIGLGHQLLAVAQGASAPKLSFGHHGANQPVRDLEGMRTYITSQNHGYAVDAATLPAGAKVRYQNANDKSCEGVDYPAMCAMSVQFAPEKCDGPHDTSFIYDRFIELMGV